MRFWPSTRVTLSQRSGALYKYRIWGVYRDQLVHILYQLLMISSPRSLTKHLLRITGFQYRTLSEFYAQKRSYGDSAVSVLFFKDTIAHRSFPSVLSSLHLTWLDPRVSACIGLSPSPKSRKIIVNIQLPILGRFHKDLP
jgi:hypothetical protein